MEWFWDHFFWLCAGLVKEDFWGAGGCGGGVGGVWGCVTDAGASGCGAE